jgi:hypothetical protein
MKSSGELIDTMRPGTDCQNGNPTRGVVAVKSYRDRVKRKRDVGWENRQMARKKERNGAKEREVRKRERRGVEKRTE